MMKIVFAGTPEIAARALSLISEKHQVELVVTMPDAPVGRKRVLTPSPVAQTADALGIPLLKTQKLDAAARARIESSQAELAIVVAYGAMINSESLALLPWWNLHFSILPNHRGATPLQHSMITGTGVGISIFELDQGLDTGPIIVQEPMTFSESETAGTSLMRFTEHGTALLLKAMEQGKQPVPQVGEASYAHKFSREDAHLSTIEPADLLVRKVRAFNPEPMAWVSVDSAPLRILEAAVLQGDHLAATKPGQLMKLETGEVVISAGDRNFMELSTVQPAGKKPMTAAAWWNGLKAGAQLD
jgi:methionyl-tRNA formyltransferase